MAVEDVSTRLLNEIVDRLVTGLHPERIYLFGSRDRSQADGGSDIDLLVVVSESSLPRHQREALSYGLLWGLTVPVDVIVLTETEFQRGSRMVTSLASTLRAQGQILYG